MRDLNLEAATSELVASNERCTTITADAKKHLSNTIGGLGFYAVTVGGILGLVAILHG